MKITIKNSKKGYKFRVENRKNTVVFESRHYTRKHDTKRAIDRFITNLPDATFEVKTRGTKSWYNMLGKTGKVVGATPRMDNSSNLTRSKNSMQRSNSFTITY